MTVGILGEAVKAGRFLRRSRSTAVSATRGSVPAITISWGNTMLIFAPPPPFPSYGVIGAFVDQLGLLRCVAGMFPSYLGRKARRTENGVV